MRVSVLSLNARYLSVGEFPPPVDHNFACGLRGSAQSDPSLRTSRNLREHCQMWNEARILSSKKQVLSENIPEGVGGIRCS